MINPIRIIKKYILYFKQNIRLEKENEQLKINLGLELKKTVDVKDIVKQILGRDIEWFDYNSFSKADKEAYSNDAKLILNSRVWNNETKRCITDIIQEIAKESDTQQMTENLRYQMIGIESLRDRFEIIATLKGKEEVTKDNVTSNI